MNEPTQPPSVTEPVKMPVCPFCKKEMYPCKFVGYYDEFYHWSCACDKLPVDDDNVGHGQFA